MSQARITIKRGNGTDAVLTLEMSADDLKVFEELAKDRGVGLVEMFGEALRLEKLFAATRSSKGRRGMYLDTGTGLRELVAV